MTTRARRVMRRLNPNALADRDGERCIFLEDVRDLAGRWWRFEYQCDPAAGEAVCFVRHNPWEGPPPDAFRADLSADGRLDLSVPRLALGGVVDLARAWCLLYSDARLRAEAPAARSAGAPASRARAPAPCS